MWFFAAPPWSSTCLPAYILTAGSHRLAVELHTFTREARPGIEPGFNRHAHARGSHKSGSWGDFLLEPATRPTPFRLSYFCSCAYLGLAPGTVSNPLGAHSI